MVTLEVCCESVASAVTARECGAHRIEFCDNMAEGGTTPSGGNIKIARDSIDIPLFPIIRPRGGDFVYTDLEFEVMKEDVKLCGEAGCDGVVAGILFPDGTVDTARMRELVYIASLYGMEVTFHRAFDVCRNLEEALEEVISTGCKRILTSGGCGTAEEGIETIGRLCRQSGGRIVVMPGSGVTPENAASIISRTGCTELHGTLRSRFESGTFKPEWADFTRWQTDPEKVKKVLDNISQL
ncbi:MAG: copper homeostasis protein CutC [Rikenellaceae bacterium]|nr:copper homeostasis protein CutC [Rikenellaceae bacterium]